MLNPILIMISVGFLLEGHAKVNEAAMIPKLKLSLEREFKIKEAGKTESGRVSATSGIVKNLEKYFLISDHEHSLYSFSMKDENLSATPILDGVLTGNQEERKKLKPDFESLAYLDDKQWPPHGALVVWPSGSTPERMRAVTLPFDAKGALQKPLLSNILPLADKMKCKAHELNMEGLTTQGDMALIFQRGNKKDGKNGIFRMPVDALVRGLKSGQWPERHDFEKYKLGKLNGVKLSLTDAVDTRYGLLALAVAEDTDSSTADGAIHGTVLMKLFNKKSQVLAHFDQAVKLEGMVVDKEFPDGSLSLLLVEDADVTDRASRLFRTNVTADILAEFATNEKKGSK